MSIDVTRAPRRRWVAPALFALALVGRMVLALPASADQTISSQGPVTAVTTSPSLGCRMGPAEAACATLASVGGKLFGPAQAPDDPASPTAFTPVSQSPVTGSGSASDPFQVVTVVDAGASGIRLTQTDSYVAGDSSVRTDVAVSNRSAPQPVTVYRGGDCPPAPADPGSGPAGAAAALPAGTVTCGPHGDPPATGTEQWIPLTPASTAFETSSPAGRAAGLSWKVTLPEGGSTTFSTRTVFGPAASGGAAPAAPPPSPAPLAPGTPVGPPAPDAAVSPAPAASSPSVPSVGVDPASLPGAAAAGSRPGAAPAAASLADHPAGLPAPAAAAASLPAPAAGLPAPDPPAPPAAYPPAGRTLHIAGLPLAGQLAGRGSGSAVDDGTGDGTRGDAGDSSDDTGDGSTPTTVAGAGAGAGARGGTSDVTNGAASADSGAGAGATMAGTGANVVPLVGMGAGATALGGLFLLGGASMGEQATVRSRRARPALARRRVTS